MKARLRLHYRSWVSGESASDFRPIGMFTFYDRQFNVSENIRISPDTPSISDEGILTETGREDRKERWRERGWERRRGDGERVGGREDRREGG